MKIMMYSQHVLGIGHFFRSMEIAKALEGHEILFVEGGDPLPGFTPPAHVKRLLLPSLMMDSEFRTIEARDGAPDETKAIRRRMLMDSFLQFMPEVLVTELFPFGRKQFRAELLPILETIRNEKLPTRVICSLRDILVEKADQRTYEERVLDTLNSYYDLLLVHSDPKLISLEETFERVVRIKIPIQYTGFIVRQAPPRCKPRDGRTLIASSGGGKVGADLLESTIRAVRSLDDEDLRLRLFIGPFTGKDDRNLINSLASQDRRITVLPFSLDFLSELAAADLSISMAGYNTCMDILSTGVKAIVYPFPQNREQRLRAIKLQDLGLLRVLDSLNPESMAQAMRNALEEPYINAASVLDLSGASSTAALILGFTD
ncbi:MAG: glycosyltransferase family protein [Syntrophobacteraceae bacterium]